MIVDQEFMEKFETFPMEKAYVYYHGQSYRTYRETFNDRAKRELCIAVSNETSETFVSFSLYHTSKTVRLKMSEGTPDDTVNFIKGFSLEDTSLLEKKSRKRLFKFLSRD